MNDNFESWISSILRRCFRHQCWPRFRRTQNSNWLHLWNERQWWLRTIWILLTTRVHCSKCRRNFKLSCRSCHSSSWIWLLERLRNGIEWRIKKFDVIQTNQFFNNNKAAFDKQKLERFSVLPDACFQIVFICSKNSQTIGMQWSQMYHKRIFSVPKPNSFRFTFCLFVDRESNEIFNLADF